MEKSINTELSTAISKSCQQEEQTQKDSTSSTDKKVNHPSKYFAIIKKPLRKVTYDNYFKATKGRKSSHNFSSGTALIPSTWQWKSHKGLIYGVSTQNIMQSNKIAMFDMDGTIIVNRNSRRHTDWEFFHPSVPQKLRELKKQGYRIVLASNQLGVSLNLISESDLQSKIQEFTAVIGVEITAMLATKNDKFRKPEPGMWHFLVNTLNHTKVDIDQCVNSV